MHKDDVLRKTILSLICVFVFALNWLLSTVYVSPARSMIFEPQQSMPVTLVSKITHISTVMKKATIPAQARHASWYPLTSRLRSPRNTNIPDAQDVKDMPLFDISFSDPRGNLLSGWMALNAPHAPVIILAHGTPGNRMSMLQRAVFLFEHGYNILLFDFQSYGKSEGPLSTLGLVESEDILAAISYVHTVPDTVDSKVGVLGLSMGATAAMLAAAKTKQISAVVAESCPVDATRVASDVPNDQVRNADRQLVRMVYGVDITRARPIDAVKRISSHTALFFVNGDKDKETPVSGMYALYQEARKPKQYWVASGAKHAQAFDLQRSEYIRRVSLFFDTYLQ